VAPSPAAPQPSALRGTAAMRHRCPLAFSAQIHRSPSANLQATALRPSEPRPGDKSQVTRPIRSVTTSCQGHVPFRHDHAHNALWRAVADSARCGRRSMTSLSVRRLSGSVCAAPSGPGRSPRQAAQAAWMVGGGVGTSSRLARSPLRPLPADGLRCPGSTGPWPGPAGASPPGGHGGSRAGSHPETSRTPG
jgi:hypothetical protein